MGQDKTSIDNIGRLYVHNNNNRQKVVIFHLVLCRPNTNEYINIVNPITDDVLSVSHFIMNNLFTSKSSFYLKRTYKLNYTNFNVYIVYTVTRLCLLYILYNKLIDGTYFPFSPSLKGSYVSRIIYPSRIT